MNWSRSTAFIEPEALICATILGGWVEEQNPVQDRIVCWTRANCRNDQLVGCH